MPINDTKKATNKSSSAPISTKSGNIAKDKDDNYVFLAETPFLLQMAEKDYPELTFHTTSEFKLTENL